MKLLLIAMLIATPLLSMGAIVCKKDKKTKGCFYKSMQLYNQKIVGKKYCSPTALSMMVSTFTHAGSLLHVDEWVNKNFVVEGLD